MNVISHQTLSPSTHISMLKYIYFHVEIYIFFSKNKTTPIKDEGLRDAGGLVCLFWGFFWGVL